MDEVLAAFSRQVRARSTENRRALEQLVPARTYGNVVGILRQELDSMVRVMYLLSVRDRHQRSALLAASIAGERWRDDRGIVTDRRMVELADSLHGWAKSVYDFGCAFIHLSSFHDYETRNPLELVTSDEREAILRHMRNYHHGPQSDHPTFEELASYLPAVFDKVSGNLDCYLKELESNGDLER